MLMSFPCVKIAGALKAPLGYSIINLLLQSRLQGDPTVQNCISTVKLVCWVPFHLANTLCPQAWKEGPVCHQAHGRAHHVLLSKCHSKAIPTSEKPGQHEHAAACILLMDSHVSCPRKLFPLYSCHLHGSRTAEGPLAAELKRIRGVFRKHCSS